MANDSENKSFTSKDIITLKFRPQKFSEFIGQPQVVIPLTNSITNGKIHHAYLFYGPRGVGKTSAARILAKMLNCLDFKEGEPCLKCDNCLEISNGISPDVIEIDGASNRGIDEIRNLQNNLVYAPTKSRYKIYIIDEVHMLTKEAFNALLKTLEEPPEHVIFIFATTEIHKVIPTIRSRCQQYQFTLFKITEIASQIIKILKEYNVTYEDEVPAIIAKYGNGSMRDALSILSQILSYNDKEIKIETVYNLLGIHSLDFIRMIFEKISSNDIAGIYSTCSQMYYQGISLDNITTQILEFIRLITLLKNGIEDINVLNQAFTDFNKLTSLSENFSTKKLVLMAKKIIEFQKSVSLWSNPFFAFENLLVSFVYDDFYITSSELLSKVQEGINNLNKAFNIVGGKPEEILLKKVPVLSNQTALKIEQKKAIEDNQLKDEEKKDENVNISNDLKAILDLSNNIKEEEKAEKTGSTIDSIQDTFTIDAIKSNTTRIEDLKDNTVKDTIKVNSMRTDDLKDNIKDNITEDTNLNNFANKLKTRLEKKIEDEEIPEPFKKLKKYMNGNYRE